MENASDSRWVLLAEDSCWLFDKVEWDAMMRLTEEAEQKFAAPVRARSQCGFQLACRHVPKTKRSQPRLDLDTGRELWNDKAKFDRAIGAKPGKIDGCFSQKTSCVLTNRHGGKL